MHSFLPFALSLFACAVPVMAAATTEPAVPEVPAVRSAVRERLAPHPRLLMTASAFKALGANTDPRVAALRERVIRLADSYLGRPPMERILEGKRLLGVSREALTRIPTLALAYRLTADPKFLEAARKNLLTIAGFSDWHPEHFLDVAEMTAAASLGYDWLFDDLKPDDRATLRRAILEKGINASYVSPPWWWVNGGNNWNQVCNGGVTLGALAIAEDEPALAERTIERAIHGLPNVMKHYAPDGAYPEGAAYWGYGTTYNCLLVDALQTSLGDDFGISEQPGFLKTADYHLHLVGPTGLNFSYSDGTEKACIDPSAAAFYLAKRRGDPSLLFNELKAFDHLLERPEVSRGHDGADWLLAAWAPGQTHGATPAATSYVGHGITPVATHRTAWTDDATFIAIKGGSPSASHAHMDVGSFCLDANGVRWVSDLGMQDYNSLETKGVDLWNGAQGSQRWQVYRLGVQTHNILSVNGHEQRDSGHAPITRSTANFTVVDTSPVYADVLAAAVRGIVLRPDGSVRLQDEITALPNAAAPVRWAILTHAEVELHGPSATLRSGKHQLQVNVVSPAGATLKIVSTDPPHAYDAPNPDSRLITFEVNLPAGASQTLAVDFTPGPTAPPASPVTPLKAW
ncbi:MAG: heparinase II/III domain-containing protein [Tepidisphaeraceae bacterium]